MSSEEKPGTGNTIEDLRRVVEEIGIEDENSHDALELSCSNETDKEPKQEAEKETVDEQEDAKEEEKTHLPTFDDILQKLKNEIKNQTKDVVESEDITSVQSRYRMACEKYKILPLEKCLAAIDSDSLDLSNLNLGRKYFKPVIEALFYSTKLRHLILSGNRLQVEGLENLAYFCGANSNITYLNYANNGVGPRGGKFVGKILKNGFNLEHVNLSQNEIDDGHVLEILPSLAENTKLTELILSDNNLTEAVGKQLGQCLVKNTCLQKLDLAYNKLKEGAAGLFVALRSNSSLKVLILTGNEIGPECAPDLGKALDANQSLEELDLGYNRLSYEAMPPVGKGMKSNSALKNLNLEYNPLFAQGAFILISSVSAADNKIEKLNLTGIRVNLNFLKILYSIKASGRVIDVKYGNRTQCEYCTKFDKSLWKENAPLVQLLEHADASGQNLKIVLQKIHAKFLNDRRAALQAQEGGATASKNAAEASKEADKLNLERYPRMEATKFVVSLVNSALKVPSEMAQSLAESFSDANLTIDVGEIIALIPLRASELEYESEKPKEGADEKKDAKKKK